MSPASSTEGGGYHPLKDFSDPLKRLFLPPIGCSQLWDHPLRSLSHPTLGKGKGKLSKLGVEGAVLT